MRIQVVWLSTLCKSPWHVCVLLGCFCLRLLFIKKKLSRERGGRNWSLLEANYPSWADAPLPRRIRLVTIPLHTITYISGLVRDPEWEMIVDKQLLQTYSVKQHGDINTCCLCFYIRYLCVIRTICGLCKYFKSQGTETTTQEFCTSWEEVIMLILDVKV